MRRTRDFADAIRPELAELPVAQPGEELLARIVASRRAGARVILPHDDPVSARPARGRLLAGAAAAALLLIAYQALTRDDETPASGLAAGSWFTRFAAAQGAPPGSPPVRITRADRLHPLAVEYGGSFRDSAGAVLSSWRTTVRLTHDSSGGGPAWRLVSDHREDKVPGRHNLDTVLVAASDLGLLAVSAHSFPYRSFSRINITQRFDGLRLSGEMTAEREGVVAARRPIARRLSPAAAPYVSNAFAPLWLMGVAIDRQWRGGLSMLGWAVRDDDVLTRLDLRVEGEESVRVPAGTFDCWRIAIRDGRGTHLYWVRKSDGLGVRTLDPVDPRGTREVVLVAEGPAR